MPRKHHSSIGSLLVLPFGFSALDAVGSLFTGTSDSIACHAEQSPYLTLTPGLANF